MDDHILGRHRIPEFASIEEAAEFWDTHDTTEFEDEWETIDLDVARPLMHQLSVRLEGPVFHRLVTTAKRRGVPVSSLAATLIREAIERVDPQAANGVPEAEPPR